MKYSEFIKIALVGTGFILFLSGMIYLGYVDYKKYEHAKSIRQEPLKIRLGTQPINR